MKRLSSLSFCVFIACGAGTAAREAEQEAAAVAYNYPDPGPCVPGAWWCGYREANLATFADACPNDRWIGYQLGANITACPRALPTAEGTWTASKLFSAATPNLLPGPHQRFCAYQWSSPSGAAPNITALPNASTLRLERDCRVVAPLLVPQPAAAAELKAAYSAQIDRPLFPAAMPPLMTKTRIAIVDSAPEEIATGLPSTAALTEHGTLMGTLARTNACLERDDGSETCLALIANHTGLPLGSGYGHPSDVAQAIVRALDAWILDAGEAHLVINLSLGWDGRYGGLHGPQTRVTVLAAWHAIQLARCHGALVFAAAGNRTTSDEAEQPTFPGGWEAERVLACPGGQEYSPLVHAVGAVDGRDVILGLARREGTPRLVAASSLHVEQLIDPLTALPAGTSMVVSGTSLSSAGVAGLAALVWSRNLGLDASQVAEVIYDSGTAIGGVADFGFGALQPKMRMNACRALMFGCLGPNCPLACLDRPAGVPALPDFATVLEAQYPGLAEAEPSPAELTIGHVPLHAHSLSLEPYAGPQPENPICPLCFVSSNILTGMLDLDGGETLAKLVLSDETGANEVSIELADPHLALKIPLAGLGLDGATSLILTGEIHNGTKIYLRASEIALD